MKKVESLRVWVLVAALGFCSCTTANKNHDTASLAGTHPDRKVAALSYVVVNCDSGAQLQAGSGFRFVITNSNAVHGFVDHYSGNMGVQANVDDGRLIIPMTSNPSNSNEWVGESNARYDHGVVYYLKPLGNGLTLEAWATTSYSGSYVKTNKLANWDFDSCTWASIRS